MVKDCSYVICIDNSDLDITNVLDRFGSVSFQVDSCTYLTVGKVYNVEYIIHSSATASGKNVYRIINDNGTVTGYYSNRFISLADSRRKKLEKLKK